VLQRKGKVIDALSNTLASRTHVGKAKTPSSQREEEANLMIRKIGRKKKAADKKW